MALVVVGVPEVMLSINQFKARDKCSLRAFSNQDDPPPQKKKSSMVSRQRLFYPSSTPLDGKGYGRLAPS